VYFEIGNHLRRTVDGIGDRCTCCNRPLRFKRKDGGDIVACKHQCSAGGRGSGERIGGGKRLTENSWAGVVEDGGTDDENDESLLGNRLAHGFAMLGFRDEFSGREGREDNVLPEGFTFPRDMREEDEVSIGSGNYRNRS
jgi:hypothetical protein